MLDQETLNLSEYFGVLRRRRRLVIAFFVAVVATVTIGSFLATPIYRATAVILIDAQSPQVMATTAGVEMGSGGYSSYYSYREYYKSQMGIITSHSIAKQVFGDLNISNLKEYKNEKEPIKKFSKSLKVEAVPDTRLLNLHAENKDPVLAAKVANHVAETYINRNLDYISKSESLNLLKNEYLRLEAKLSEYSKIYKDKHPEIIRVKEEMSDLSENIARAKESSFVINNQAQGQHRHALASLKANNVSIIEYARESVYPVRPHKKLNILLAMVVGLLGGAGLAFFVEYQDATIKDAEDIEKLTTWTFLGAVPRIVEGKKEFHVQVKPDDFITEAYRSIRTQIFFSNTKENPLKAIVISSLGPEEGKTTTICNLGIAIAQNQKKVLLVDADMRRPRLHKVLKGKDSKGLCSYLSEDISYESLIQKTEIENLFFVSDSRSCVNSSELLARDKMGEFLKNAKKDFDYVIFDSPPIGAITDAAILSPMVDGLILVVESAKTPKRVVRRSFKQLKDSAIRCVGVIINRVDISRKEGYYYYHPYSKTT